MGYGRTATFHNRFFPFHVAVGVEEGDAFLVETVIHKVVACGFNVEYIFGTAPLSYFSQRMFGSSVMALSAMGLLMPYSRNVPLLGSVVVLTARCWAKRLPAAITVRMRVNNRGFFIMLIV